MELIITGFQPPVIKLSAPIRLSSDPFLGFFLCRDDKERPAGIFFHIAAETLIEPGNGRFLADPLSIGRIGDDDAVGHTSGRKLLHIRDLKTDAVVDSRLGSIFRGGLNSPRIGI